MQTSRPGIATLSALGLVLLLQVPSNAQAPFKLGVEEKGYLNDDPYGGGAQYPSPQYVGDPQPLKGGAQHTEKPKKKQAPPQLKPQVPVQAAVPQQRPMNVGIQQSVQLPAGFMGSWLVSGQRTQVQAQPQFQQAVGSIFAEQTQNVWNITGDPSSGYAFSNDSGVKSAIFVDKVSGDTAFIRYQHPIKNTMAQEAIVMQLVPGGAQFNGLERISIVKQGEPPRAQVTYQLMGRRRR